MNFTDAKILERFSNLSVLIVGDICLDRWCKYDPALALPSRETGLPRTAVVSSTVTPGAAGTIANNLAALKCGRVALLGAVGDDGNGMELLRALQARGISTEYIHKSTLMPTFTYTKLINKETGVEDLPRVDFIPADGVPHHVEHHIVNTFGAIFDNFNVILISDQAETDQGGLITAEVRKVVAEAAKNYPDKVIVVDSRLRATEFQGVILKPNQDEAEAASMKLLGRVDFPAMRRKLHAPVLIVTKGAEGVTVYRPDCENHVKTEAVENPVDICGAGDSFAAGFSLAMAVTGDAVRAAQFGNKVASITIMKPGTGTASPEEILAK